MPKRSTINFLIFTTVCFGCDRSNDRVKQLEVENEALKKEIAQLKSHSENGEISKGDKAPGANIGPGKSLRNALMAANVGNYSEANRYVSSGLLDTYKKAGGGDGMVNLMLWNEITQKGTLKNIEVSKEEIRGEGATLHFKITYEKHRPFESSASVFQEDGKWKFGLGVIGIIRLPDDERVPPVPPLKFIKDIEQNPTTK